MFCRREKLIEDVENILERADFNTCKAVGCFDIAAKRELVLLVKVLLNVDSFMYEQASNLGASADFFKASPLLIGLRTRTNPVEENVVYERFGFQCISPKTLENILKNELPFIRAESGGYVVEVDGEAFVGCMESMKISASGLARKTGVSVKTVKKYASGAKSKVETALRMEEVLDREVVKPINVFAYHGKSQMEKTNYKDYFTKSVERDFKKIGFDTSCFTNAPFDMLAKEEFLLVTIASKNKYRAKRMAKGMRNLCDVVEEHGAFIVKDVKEDNISGVPVVKKKELDGMRESKELLELVEKREV